MGNIISANGVGFLKDETTGQVVGFRALDGSESYFSPVSEYAETSTPVVAGGDAFVGLANALACGDASYGLLLLSDSLGDQTSDFFYRWVNERLLGRTDMRVEYYEWNTSTQVYGPPTVLKAGSAGERRIEFNNNSRSLLTSEVATRTVAADMEVEVKLSLDDWTPAVATRIVGQLGSSGNYSWWLNVRTNGYIDFIWSADGTNLITATSTAAIGFDDGQIGYIRVKFDGNNGASGNTTTFEKSTDGVTWTNFGTDTKAGTSSVKTDSTANYQIGAVSGTGPVYGDVYRVAIRDGIDGPIITPFNIDAWSADNDDAATYRDQELAGSPTLYVFQGAASGQGIAYFDDATRRPKLMPYVTAMTTLLCTNHNDAAYRPGRGASAGWATFLSNLRSRLPGTAVVIVNENPRDISLSAGRPFYYAVHARARQLAGIAQQNFAGFIDTFAAFRRAVAAKDYSLADLVNDGVHPTQNGAGVDLMVEEVDRPFRRRLYR